MHKWNSNVPELEADNQLTEDSQTYAKEQLGGETYGAELLRLPWDKVEDTLAVTFSGESQEATERSAKELTFFRWQFNLSRAPWSRGGGI